MRGFVEHNTHRRYPTDGEVGRHASSDSDTPSDTVNSRQFRSSKIGIRCHRDRTFRSEVDEANT